jgi:hypothetical protein
VHHLAKNSAGALGLGVYKTPQQAYILSKLSPVTFIKRSSVSLRYTLILTFYLSLCLQSGILSSSPNQNSVMFLGPPIQVHLCVCNSLCFHPQRLRCQRKEPCRLFTVRKRQELLDEVNTSTLCQCPHGHTCPRHHRDAGVIVGKSYTEEAIKTYSGYCIS